MRRSPVPVNGDAFPRRKPVDVGVAIAAVAMCPWLHTPNINYMRSQLLSPSLTR